MYPTSILLIYVFHNFHTFIRLQTYNSESIQNFEKYSIFLGVLINYDMKNNTNIGFSR